MLQVEGEVKGVRVVGRARAWARVVLPLAVPPAIPMTKGLGALTPP